jgi:thimet oligopeptidase
VHRTTIVLSAILMLAAFAVAGPKTSPKTEQKEDMSKNSAATLPRPKAEHKHAPPAGASVLMTASPDDFMKTCHANMDTARAAMTKLKALKTQDAIERLQTFDEGQEALGDAGARSGLTHEVHPDKGVREAAETCEQEVAALATEFSLDRGIYDGLAKMDLTKMDPASKYYVEKTLRDFKLAGVDRDDATRARVKQLNDELVKLGQEFGKNIREGVLTLEVDPKDLDGMPEDFLKGHPVGANGKVVLKTDNTDYVPVMTYAKSEKVREEFWKLYRLRAHPKNLDTLNQMLAKRYELAKLLGFDNWADYITANKMIGSGKNAAEFIEKITKAAAERSKKDYSDLLARKKKDDAAATEVEPWDTSYLTDRIKAEQYGVESSEVRPYFQYDNVKRGVLQTTSRMFGITYKPVKDAKVWHPDVETYDIYDGARNLGRIYLDMYPRENKYKHYAQFTLVNGKEGVALPEGVLVCNFHKPTADDPGLLEYSDTITFFHEFGHLLHHVLGGHTKWAGIAGVSTEQDFVEAPSQMLEEWMRDPKTLQTFAIHYQTKKPIPVELAQKLKKADEFGKGLNVRQQMFYAATSLDLHNRDPKDLDTTKLVAQLQEQYTPFHYVSGTYFHESFGHLDGYSAVYYTYMWSLVIAKDMFSVFHDSGNIMDPKIAARYRKAVLAPGGSKPAAELVKDFIGRPYGFKSYEEWLNRN